MLLRLKIVELTTQKQNWTMKQLAEKLNVDHQTVMYWNQGRCYPRLPMLLKLCQILECTLQELIDS